MAFDEIPRPMKLNKIEEENNYIAIGDVPKPMSFDENDDNDDECNYMALDELPPPLPPRIKADNVEKTKCCDSDRCVCYIEVIGGKDDDEAN